MAKNTISSLQTCIFKKQELTPNLFSRGRMRLFLSHLLIQKSYSRQKNGGEYNFVFCQM